MKCKKCKWDYVGNFSIGRNPIIMERPRYAKWVCPYCKKKRLVKLMEGVRG